jgi:transposase
MSETTVFPEQFKRVSDFLISELGISVKLGNCSRFIRSQKKIIIHRNHNLEKNGLYVLLHEAGHAFQPETYTGANLYKAIDDTRFPIKFAMYQFFNEQDAWNKAIEIAETLKIKIDARAFNKIKEDSLLTYYKYQY